MQLEPPPENPNRFFKYLEDISRSLPEAIEKAKEVFQSVLEEIRNYREAESGIGEPPGVPKDRKRFQRTATGHMIAEAAVQQALNRTEAFVAHYSSSTQNEFTRWEELEGELNEATRGARLLLRPVKNFLSSMLDHELAAAMSGGYGKCDPGEMVCAAASFGNLLDESEKDNRLHRAAEYLSKVLSDSGQFPRGRPIHLHRDGSFTSFTNIPSAVVMGAFAQLLQLARYPVEPELATKMLRLFLETRADYPHHKQGAIKGWTYEYAPEPRVSHTGATAIATQVLARINRMLDERINDVILNHFTVKTPKQLEEEIPDLDGLFYPDYGLSLAPKAIARASIAFVLQEMRAHVEKVRLRSKDGDNCYSLVLHGPPGTGKTTLVEALALTCGVPLVEVTPSDIVVRGEEAIERRARAVFEALSLLTRAVIVFDEFEPVLKKRAFQDASPMNVFSFLTPGMLPKLKTLNKRAKRRSVAYVLITNLIDTLEEAAVRTGRFDKKVGIYPPDLLSRIGRFVSEANRIELPRPADFWRRVLIVIKETSNLGMHQLGRRGWFTYLEAKKIEKKKGTPFHYGFLSSSDEPEWPDAEAIFPNEDEIKKLRTNVAKLEYRQWCWVHDWDSKLPQSLKQDDDARRILYATLQGSNSSKTTEDPLTPNIK